MHQYRERLPKSRIEKESFRSERHRRGGPQLSYRKIVIIHAISEQVQRRSEMGDWMVRDAVRSEPVSGVIFPVSREFTGKKCVSEVL